MLSQFLLLPPVPSNPTLTSLWSIVTNTTTTIVNSACAEDACEAVMAVSSAQYCASFVTTGAVTELNDPLDVFFTCTSENPVAGLDMQIICGNGTTIDGVSVPLGS